jgi:hypothetical protein
VASFAYDLASVLALGMLLVECSPTPRVLGRLALLVFGVLAGKLVLQASPLSSSFAAACLAGVAVWAAWGARFGRGALLATLAAMLAGYTALALAPFELLEVPAPFDWIPFQALLEGSMSANVRSLLAQLFAFGAMLWLVDRAGGRVSGAATPLALWVGLIEFAQRWIVGRTPDITPPLLVIALAVVLARIGRGEARRQTAAVS